MRLVRTRPEDFAVSPKLSGVRTSLQFVRTRPERRSTDGVKIATRPNSSRRNCKFAIRPDEFDSFFLFFQNTFNYSSASELVRTSVKLVRIHSLTVDGRVGVCIFAWHSSGRNCNSSELVRTSLNFVRTRPDEFTIFLISNPTSGQVCNFLELIRTILAIPHLRTRPSTVDGQRN